MKKLEKRFGPDVVIFYMDDILITSKTVEEAVEKLETVLQVLEDTGLTLKLSKCRFLEDKI